MFGAHQVVRPPQDALPHVWREVIRNVLRHRDGGEETVRARAAHDEQPQPNNGTRVGHTIEEQGPA